jgi:hypothetical protein
MVEIDVNGFTGMNNLDPSFYGGKGGIVSPRLVLNADVDDSGTINKRDGFTLYLTLAGSHSLWACDVCMLCAASGKLYSIGGGAAVQVATVSGPVNEPLGYCLCEDKVYVSNSYWRGVFDASTNTVTDWGITLPSGPMLLSSVGSLPAGMYHVCFTAVSGSELSGNGPISSIELTTVGGIQILNRPAGALVWATDQHGYIFSLVGAVDNIADIPTIEPLPSFMCGPPPNLACPTYAFGRMWGAFEQELYYSEPYQPGWFKLTSNRFKFDSDITIIAKVPTGLFIGMKDKTVFLSGTEPDQMQQTNAGAGSIAGSLVYCNNMPELGDILGTPEKGYVDVPVWRTTEGFVAGNASGRLFNLTKHKIKMGTPNRAASLYRQKDGAFQFLSSSVLGSTGSGLGSVDAKLREALASGRLTVTSASRGNAESAARCGDEANIEVRRGGVIVPA